MENPAAVHRLKIGVPATVEHASGENAGVETGKWVAEVTQVSFRPLSPRPSLASPLLCLSPGAWIALLQLSS